MQVDVTSNPGAEAEHGGKEEQVDVGVDVDVEMRDASPPSSPARPLVAAAQKEVVEERQESKATDRTDAEVTGAADSLDDENHKEGSDRAEELFDGRHGDLFPRLGHRLRPGHPYWPSAPEHDASDDAPLPVLLGRHFTYAWVIKNTGAVPFPTRLRLLQVVVTRRRWTFLGSVSVDGGDGSTVSGDEDFLERVSPAVNEKSGQRRRTGEQRQHGCGRRRGSRRAEEPNFLSTDLDRRLLRSALAPGQSARIVLPKRVSPLCPGVCRQTWALVDDLGRGIVGGLPLV
ncbi:hypothetical protein OC835_001818 [Tilletia horrida]|nr:hypothetical protein OC835_001818 [Tilletia horrida]